MLSSMKIGFDPRTGPIGEDNKVAVKTAHIPDRKPLSFRSSRPSQTNETSTPRATMPGNTKPRASFIVWV